MASSSTHLLAFPSNDLSRTRLFLTTSVAPLVQACTFLTLFYCGPFTALLITPSPLRFILHAATGVCCENESHMKSFCSEAPQGLSMSLTEMPKSLHDPHGLRPGLPSPSQPLALLFQPVSPVPAPGPLHVLSPQPGPLLP